MTEATLIIIASENGRDPWTLVLPEDVPAWVKAPDNIAKMLRGHECMKADEGDKGSKWYRAVTIEDFERMAEEERKVLH